MKMNKEWYNELMIHWCNMRRKDNWTERRRESVSESFWWTDSEDSSYSYESKVPTTALETNIEAQKPRG